MDEGRPSVSRDGQWIYFRSNRGGAQQIWKVPASQPAEPRQVTQGGGFDALEAPDGRLYYIRHQFEAGLFVVPPGGGTEVPVLPDVRTTLWAMADTGIYYISRPSRWRGGEVRRYAFDTANVTPVMRVPTTDGRIWAGFTVSSDGRTIAWTQMDRDDSDIMLIDNFR